MEKLMDESLLEIRSYEGEGYKPLIDYADWRVAILNFLDSVRPDLNDTMERHMETDEVFVLTRGKGTLLMGGNASKVEGIYPEPMEVGKIYNVKRNAWHSILLSRDASILLVENKDTGKHNTEYFDLSAEQHRFVMETAQRAGFE
jgi:mannose-6-phosphate isomerase-like protein (cupin superfamily)